MLTTIKQPANCAMLATQHQAHYSDYDKRANDRADNHSRKFHECRAAWKAKRQGQGK